jgi:hypothetical protein
MKFIYVIEILLFSQNILGYWLSYNPMGGRLGNQFFEYFSTLGIAKKNNLNFCVRRITDYIEKFVNNSSITICDKDIEFSGQSDDGHGKYKNFIITDNTKLNGYLQSYKYFEGLNLKEYGLINFQDKHKLEKENNYTYISIHIRRGDHLNLKYLIFPPDEYFINIMGYFRNKYKNIHFIVGTDDLDWVGSQTFFKGTDTSILKYSVEKDFSLLSQSDHAIISIGTFGWWIGYLIQLNNKDAEIFYYSKEYNLEHPVNNNSVILEDYYLPTWKNELELNYSLTCVSSYFPVKNKHDNNYLEWFKNTLFVNCPYVFFTDKENIELIKNFRINLPTYFIETKIEHFYTLQYRNKMIIDTYHCPSIELNLIWNEKIFMVQKAKEINPYNSNWFMWIDAGICIYRYDMPPKNFPNKNILETLPINKFIYSSSSTYNELYTTKTNYYHHIAGTSYILEKTFIDSFVTIYKNYLELIDTNNIWTDQVILTHIYKDYPELFFKLSEGYGTITNIIFNDNN